MKKILSLLFAAILLTVAISAQTSDDNPELAKGDPPLTKGLVDRAQLFFEWTLDGKFTKPQRKTLENILIQQWQTDTKENIKAMVQLMAVPEAAAKQSEADQITIHDKFRQALIQMIEKDSDNELNKLLAKVKDSKSADDILDRKSSDAIPQGTNAEIPGVSASSLAGEWLYRIRGAKIIYSDGAGNYDNPSGEMSGYKLKPNGTYEHGYLLSSSLYSCNTTIFGYETGTWSLAGNAIVFKEKTSTLTSKDTCRAAGNYVKKRELRHYYYNFKLERDEYGLKIAFLLTDGGEEPYYKQDPGKMGW